MITQRDILLSKIQLIDKKTFNQIALEVFHYQYINNHLYQKYLSLIQVKPNTIKSIQDIPFLPISFFKTHIVKTVDGVQCTVHGEGERVFLSSGTSGERTSRHLVRDVSFYKKNTLRGFQFFYEKVEDYCILGLLPSYLERSDSSLIAMVDYFISLSKHSQSGFFLYNHEELAMILKECKQKNTPTLLIGVSFALLDFAERYTIDLEDIIIMETGGMKGRRKEITRTELHTFLKKSFNVNAIHSEYGMTELLSQAYSKRDGLFYPSPTMKVITREITDPFANQKNGNTGVLNIIDLANIDSCAFIATDDLGKVYENGSFEILGRLDNSDIRGCNLIINR